MSNKDSKDKSSDKRDLFLSSLPKKKIKKIGLTGVMGSGKSSVIAILKQFDIPVLDCDAINEQLQLPNEKGYQAIIAQFGSEILKDTVIDKEKLANLIFHDPSCKKKLENIMHPLIKEEIMKRLAMMSEAMAVVEVPLLFEIHWETFFDEIWVVACDEEILLERLATQRNISQQEAKLRLSHQMSQKEKIRNATFVLYNNGNREDLKKQIIDVLRKGQLNVKNR